MNRQERRRALGKGLSALLPQAAEPPAPAPTVAPAGSTVTHLPVAQIRPNPLQPRTVFDPERLRELANSIQANGIIQPLIVRQNGEHYELIAGERRLRAAKLADLDEVPVVVQDYADDQLLELALVENIQREDLNPIETAEALSRLSSEMSLSHEQIAERTGKDRTTITNLIRLLRLPSAVQLLLAERKLSMGHGRALLGLLTEERQVELAQKAAQLGYSVRQIEKLVQQSNEPPKQEAQEPAQDPNVKAAVRDLESALGTRVRIVEKSAQAGRIEIEYFTQEDLNRLYELLVGAGGRS
ncbi:MAG TPA: ParB/RepB/Spo0J family partition protein [Bryobacteraceae bacterium]|nr:ParB/RepB/Spo0J family partition protein [Bryobacteraceae bacterium]